MTFKRPSSRGDGVVPTDAPTLRGVLPTSYLRSATGIETAKSEYCPTEPMNNRSYGRMPAAKNAPRDLFRVLERRHGLADIVVRGAGVLS